MVHPSPKLGAGGRIFKHRHLRAGSLQILKLILRPHSGCRGGIRTHMFRAYEAGELPVLYPAIIGATVGNRTRDSTLARLHVTITLQSQELTWAFLTGAQQSSWWFHVFDKQGSQFDKSLCFTCPYLSYTESPSVRSRLFVPGGVASH